MPVEKVEFSCFTDILCVWSYVAEIRMNELREQFTDRINITYHFITLFGCTQRRIDKGWENKGGYAGFADYVSNVCKEFSHVELHPDVWRVVRPRSSANAHLLLKATQQLESCNEIYNGTTLDGRKRTLFEELTWRIRCAFFKDGKDIGNMSLLYKIAESVQLPIARIKESINDGSAMAALCCDNELREQHRIEGSPSYLLNNGRQKLYGNVGYRIIEANIEELLERPEDMASWC